ncbi:hypothetical protein MMC21_005792 [Puttea exsequens]|nr:hypothetical protein [Puttea exsequens]
MGLLPYLRTCRNLSSRRISTLPNLRGWLRIRDDVEGLTGKEPYRGNLDDGGGMHGATGRRLVTFFVETSGFVRIDVNGEALEMVARGLTVTVFTGTDGVGLIGGSDGASATLAEGLTVTVIAGVDSVVLIGGSDVAIAMAARV